uniref:ATP-dependent DNA helicase n=1 Tax=Amphimedon queenslandica TaxID=400682 RepID=A0A1X7U8Y9_AMPQE
MTYSNQTNGLVVRMFFVGDNLQLPPVYGQPVFDKVTASTLKHRLGSMVAVNIWRDTVTFDELTINKRQKTDQKFSEKLDKVRRASGRAYSCYTFQKCIFKAC